MMYETTQAVILAAGRGSRLGELTRDRPKCLLDIGGGVTILEQQITSLRTHGTSEILVVAGFQWRAVEAALEQSGLSNWRLIVNPRPTETDSLYSLWLARDLMRGPLVVLNGDVVASPCVYELLCGGSDTNCLLYDDTSGRDSEHMKVAIDERGCLVGLSKELATDKVRGESLGMVRLKAPATAGLVRETGFLINDGFHRTSAAKAIARLSVREPILCRDIGSAEWIEIDYPQDLKAAQAMKFAVEDI